MIAAMCPSCEERIELRANTPLLHQMFRCPTCDTRLLVADDQPVQLRKFTSDGLPFASGDLSRIWLAGGRREHAVSSMHEHAAS